MNLPEGSSVVTLRAFYTEDPSLISDPSNALDILILTSVPEAPVGFFAD
jgi:hypothetical protein